MDGGTGSDELNGGNGDDMYFANYVSDRVIEGSDGGTETAWPFLSSFTLGANVEDLRFNGLGGFTGIVNGLANAIQGGVEVDCLYGGAGNDTLLVGRGANLLDGGAGSDTASYADTSAIINVRLGPNSGGYGDDATGDVYLGIENFMGSDFGAGSSARAMPSAGCRRPHSPPIASRPTRAV